MLKNYRLHKQFLAVLTILFGVSMFVAVQNADAATPRAYGYVRATTTNAPISGVWVRWTDGNNATRYAQTNSSGKFEFTPWQGMSSSQRLAEYNQWIDSDLNGSNDTRRASTNNYNAFSPAQNPHEFQVVPVDPSSGLEGIFTTSSGLNRKLITNLSNTVASVKVENFKFIYEGSEYSVPSFRGNYGVWYDQWWTRTELIWWNFTLSESSLVTIFAQQNQIGDDHHPQPNEEALVTTPCGTHRFEDGVIQDERLLTHTFSCVLSPGTYTIFSQWDGYRYDTSLNGRGSYQINMTMNSQPNITATPTISPTPAPTSTPIPTATPVPTATPIPAKVSASVRQNLDATCNYYGASLGTTSTFTLSSATCGYSNSVTAANSNHTFTGIDCFANDYKLNMIYHDPSYIFRCDGRNNNQYESTFSLSPDENKQVYKVVSMIREPWIQVRSGDAYAHENIALEIPGTAATGPYFVTNPFGAAIAGDSITVTVDGVTDLAYASQNGHRIENYEINSYSFDDMKQSILANADVTTYSGSRPTPNDVDGNGVTVLYAPSSITLNGSWQNLDGTYIVFAEGNINIPHSMTPSTERKISLSNNGFLMLYSAQDILVDREIGTEDANDSTNHQLEGFFIAGRNIEFLGNNDRDEDERVNVYGSGVVGVHVTAGTVVSNRSHEDNYLHPAVTFSFNPKLLLNAPRAVISQPNYTWNEIQ